MQAVRGMRDLFGDSLDKFNAVVEKAKYFANLYNFTELQTPIVEHSEIFERNLGENSEIVLKEMYKFQDKGGNNLSLRPEFTAGVVRAVISNPELENYPHKKFFSFGPIFRYERPQKGRYRQFHQINFEYFGNPGHLADVEIIYMGNSFLRSLGLSATLEINSLGSKGSRERYEDALREYFGKYFGDLSELSKQRLEKNALRILDSKEESDKKLLPGAPKIKDFYTLDDREFFSNILNKLDLLRVKYLINPNLVRGLDYYTSTVFEFTATELGAQSTALAGGRYDDLVEQMGGKNTPSVGFGAGIERLSLLIKQPRPKTRPIGLICIGEKEIDYCLRLQAMLRENGFNAEGFFSGKIKQKLTLADKINCKYAIIVGEEEIMEKKLGIKNLDSGEEKKIEENNIMNFLKSVSEEDIARRAGNEL